MQSILMIFTNFDDVLVFVFSDAYENRFEKPQLMYLTYTIRAFDCSTMFL